MITNVQQTKLKDVRLIVPWKFEDHRGTYVETYNLKEYKENELKTDFVRDDISTSSKNVLRGLHYDDKTWKLIQCMYGKIYFVVVDMRKDSEQYLQWQSFILTSENRHQVLVPPMHANGHLVLSEECIFHYKMSHYYNPDNEKGVRWNDPKLNIFWPVKEPILSIKDTNTPNL